MYGKKVVRHSSIYPTNSLVQVFGEETGSPLPNYAYMQDLLYM